jgi:hypothetical protein
MTEQGELYKQLQKIYTQELIDDDWPEFDEAAKPILDAAKTDFPKLTVIAGIPMWEEYYKDICKWFTRWFGAP